MNYNDQIYYNLIVSFFKWHYNTSYAKILFNPMKGIRGNNGDSAHAIYVTENRSTLKIYSSRWKFCQSTPYNKHVWAKIPYMKQFLVRKTFKRKIITAYQKKNSKQDVRTIYLSIYLSIYRSSYLYFFLSIYLPVYLSICVSTYTLK